MILKEALSECKKLQQEHVRARVVVYRITNDDYGVRLYLSPHIVEFTKAGEMK